MRPLDRRAFKKILIERVHLRSYYRTFSESTTETLQLKMLQVEYVVIPNTTSVPLINNFTKRVVYATMTKTQTQAC